LTGPRSTGRAAAAAAVRRCCWSTAATGWPAASTRSRNSGRDRRVIAIELDGHGHIDATGDLLRQPYDWSAEVAALPMPVLLVYADADSMPPSAAAEFYGLLGGGQRDANWDASLRSPSWLTILTGTHYDILSAHALPRTVTEFTA